MSDEPPTCQCGSGDSLADCCGRFVDAGQAPETAEQLMRSRFTAYCRKNIDYLVNSTHPDARSKRLREEIEETAETIKWTSLEVVSTSQGRAKDKIGKVEFIADYEFNGERKTHRERSRFRRFQGKWTYLDDRG
tara:strand:+ start:476 stop:877 length:402 start_codon:yes stop_codon:yes gene_type:complete